MAAPGRGAVDVFIPEIVRPPGKIHVLIVGEKQFVKNADLIQNGSAVERRAAAGRKDPAGLLVAAGFQPVAPLAGKPQDGHIIPGVVGQFGLIVAQHQAGHRKNFRVGPGGFQQFGQPVRLGEGVVVEQRHVFAAGDGDALVHCVGKAGVAVVLDQGVAVAAAVAARDLPAFVGGTVVNNDQFKVLLGLGPDGFYGIPQPARAVQVGDDDRGFHGFSFRAFNNRGRGSRTASAPTRPPPRTAAAPPRQPRAACGSGTPGPDGGGPGFW